MNTVALEDEARVLSFSGIYNFRDYGGYTLAGGGRLRRGLLYRSAQHRDATADDLAHVASLGLGAVIDLRGPAERREAPCPRALAFDARVRFIDDETAGLAPHVQAARNIGNADEARAALRRGYATMPFRPALVQAMTLYFEEIAATAGPTLVHCVAGKDRTGLVVALLHALLGVHRDDLFADYLLTNSAGNIDARLAEGVTHLRKTYGDALDDGAARVLMSVDDSYLEAAFAAIVDRHGSVDGYLAAKLGVSPGRRAAIAARLVG